LVKSGAGWLQNGKQVFARLDFERIMLEGNTRGWLSRRRVSFLCWTLHGCYRSWALKKEKGIFSVLDIQWRILELGVREGEGCLFCAGRSMEDTQGGEGGCGGAKGLRRRRALGRRRLEGKERKVVKEKWVFVMLDLEWRILEGRT
jgi:hypothetical protein